MSKKTIIISRKQLDEICGGNSAYLDNLSSTPDKTEDGYNEITVGGNMENGYPLPKTTDDYAKSMTRKWAIGSAGAGKRAYPGVYYESKGDWKAKNSINETNSELDGQNITAVVNGKKITGNENSLSTRLSRAEKNGNKDEADALRKSLDNRRKPIAARKKNYKNIGIENAYQKQGGTKTQGNGKAHTSKGEKITYFN